MFTKQHAKQNKQLQKRAEQLLDSSSYDPGRELAEFGHTQEISEWLLEQLTAEFPDVTEDRLRSRVASAMRKARGRWVA